MHSVARSLVPLALAASGLAAAAVTPPADPWGQSAAAASSEDCAALPSCRAIGKLPLDLGALVKQVAGVKPRAPAPGAKRLARSAPRQRHKAEASAGAEAAARIWPWRGRPRKAEPDRVTPLVEALRSSSARTRALAADMLGDLGAEAAAALPALRKALADPSPRVRSSAARALGEASPPHPGPEILAALHFALLDPSEDVRLSSKAALGRLASVAR